MADMIIPCFNPFVRIVDFRELFEITGTIQTSNVSNFYSPSPDFYTGYYIETVISNFNQLDLAIFNVTFGRYNGANIRVIENGTSIGLSIVTLTATLSASTTVTGLATTHACPIPNHTRELAEQYAASSIGKTVKFQFARP